MQDRTICVSVPVDLHLVASGRGGGKIGLNGGKRERYHGAAEKRRSEGQRDGTGMSRWIPRPKDSRQCLRKRVAVAKMFGRKHPPFRRLTCDGADVPPAESVETIAEGAANARIANKLAMLTCSTVPPTDQVVISLKYYVSFVLRRCSTDCIEFAGEVCPCTIHYYL